VAGQPQVRDRSTAALGSTLPVRQPVHQHAADPLHSARNTSHQRFQGVTALFRGWQLRGEAPTIQPALALYRELWAGGYTLTLITGRSAHAFEMHGVPISIRVSWT
jgi:hypothetical protein